MIRKTFTVTLSIPRAIVYYVPFCPRPTMLVTPETLDKLEKAQCESLGDMKPRLVQAMQKHFGERLVVASPHLFPGTLTRAVLLSTPIGLPLTLVEPFMGLGWMTGQILCHAFITMFELDTQIALSSKYRALCGE